MRSAAAVLGMVVKPRYSEGLNRLEDYRLVAGAAAFLPRPARLAAARAVGRGVGPRVAAEWRTVRGNLVRVLPEATPRELEQAVSDTCANFGAFFVVSLDAHATLARYVARRAGDEYLGADAVRAHPTQWFNFSNVWAPPVAAI